MRTNKLNDFVSSYRRRLVNSRDKAIMASHYYERENTKLQFPIICFSSLSGFICFLASSKVIAIANYQEILTMSAGFISVLSSIVQAVSNNLKYQARADSFRMQAEAYSALITRMRFFNYSPSEPGEFIQLLETKILEVKSRQQYFIPLHILETYQEIHDIITHDSVSESTEEKIDIGHLEMASTS